MPFSGISQQSLVGSVLSFPVKLLKWGWHTVVAILLFPIHLLQAIFNVTLKILHKLLPHIFMENVSQTSRLLGSLFLILLGGALFCVVVLGIIHIIAVSGATIFSDVDAGQAVLIAGKATLVTGGVFIILAAGGFLLSSLLSIIGITVYSSTKTALEIFEELTGSRLVLLAMFITAVVIFGIVFGILSGKLPL
ncbi:hypothetical protein U14_00604 [Candidatus Moduliflexus flocculans]|uniref:Uncharacterized protein n=1 Tax=Candidatus Moduliflexus flocculans TaxID=1499966 RepID=A0A0S6VW67_9BACT|nr:hypothetical protein U14_00604 [Candidatus Moduliflexus flocculans]